MPQWRSRERVYDVDESGQPWRLRYAVGDVIDEAEARRQGLIAHEQPKQPPQPKAIPEPPADKARRATPNKTRKDLP